MKFLLVAVFICFAIILATVSAVPVEEAIPEGFGASADDRVNPTDDQSFLLKLKLLKKLLFLG